MAAPETRNARVVLFTGGPVTEGNGAVVETEVTQTIRSHQDILKGNAKLFDKAFEV